MWSFCVPVPATLPLHDPRSDPLLAAFRFRDCLLRRCGDISQRPASPARDRDPDRQKPDKGKPQNPEKDPERNTTQGSVDGFPRTFAVFVLVVVLPAPTGKGGGVTTGDLGRVGGSIVRPVLRSVVGLRARGIDEKRTPQTGQTARPVAETALIKMERPQEHLTVIAMWSTPSSDRSIARSSCEPQNSSIEVSVASLPINSRDEYPSPRRHHQCQQTWIITDYEREQPFFLKTDSVRWQRIQIGSLIHYLSRLLGEPVRSFSKLCLIFTTCSVIPARVQIPDATSVVPN